MNNTRLFLKAFAAAFGCFLLFAVMYKLATRVPEELSAEDLVKAQITKILAPLLAKESFRVEVSQTRKDYRLEKQTVAILIDEAKILPQETLTQVDALLRAAIGHDVSRGDILRITSVAFNAGANSFSLSNEQKLYALEALIVIALFALSALYMQRRKAPPVQHINAELTTPKPASLSAQVVAEPAKAAAILRVWLSEKDAAHG